MKGKKNTRLIVVSNRLPIIVKKSIGDGYEFIHAAGGLITAMEPVLNKYSGLWVGWAGNYKEEKVHLGELLEKEMKGLNYKYKSVDITLHDYELYYKGFANEVLWPLFHNVSVYCKYEIKSYRAYEKVNKIFADKIITELTENDFIWVHDYHLINTGKYLRQSGVKNKMAFFLHIPFPPAETFNRMPWRLDIVKALFTYDLIGFQTESDKKNFLEVVDSLIENSIIEDRESDISTIVDKRREHKVGVFSISIDYDDFHGSAKSEKVLSTMEEIKKSYPDQKIMLGIDRLDYTKGLPQKLKAFRELLAKNPRLHKKVKLIQIMVPSREDIEEYSSLKSEIEELIGEINGKFSQLGWIPILYSYDTLSREELLAYYRASEIALVTPLKDGMNLVAKEYCAANIEKDGILVLSEFAGVKYQFKNDALLVNPFDEESFVKVMKEALSMDEKEKLERMENLQKNVKKFDIYWWVDAFLTSSQI